jgi:hypothetical protein
VSASEILEADGAVSAGSDIVREQNNYPNLPPARPDRNAGLLGLSPPLHLICLLKEQYEEDQHPQFQAGHPDHRPRSQSADPAEPRA